MAKVKYIIFQFKDIYKVRYGFRSWANSKEKFNIDDYKKVYAGEIEQENCLERLFEIFNLDHPTDFRGHSLSVSDVIAIKKEGNDYYYWYYCDSFGWEEITEVVNEQILNLWIQNAIIA